MLFCFISIFVGFQSWFREIKFTSVHASWFSFHLTFSFFLFLSLLFFVFFLHSSILFSPVSFFIRLFLFFFSSLFPPSLCLFLPSGSASYSCPATYFLFLSHPSSSSYPTTHFLFLFCFSFIFFLLSYYSLPLSFLLLIHLLPLLLFTSSLFFFSSIFHLFSYYLLSLFFSTSHSCSSSSISFYDIFTNPPIYFIIKKIYIYFDITNTRFGFSSGWLPIMYIIINIRY